MPRVVPEYKKQASERILKAARQVFSEKGYYESRMEDIADRVGVSKRTLYLYFKNKEELFAAMTAAEPQALEGILHSVLNTDDFLDACKTFWDLTVKEPVSGLNFELIAAASRNPTLKRTMRELYQNEANVLERFLEEMKEKGNLSPKANSRVLALALVALHDGLTADSVLGLDKALVRQAWLESAEMLLRNTLSIGTK